MDTSHTKVNYHTKNILVLLFKSYPNVLHIQICFKIKYTSAFWVDPYYLQKIGILIIHRPLRLIVTRKLTLIEKSPSEQFLLSSAIGHGTKNLPKWHGLAQWSRDQHPLRSSYASIASKSTRLCLSRKWCSPGTDAYSQSRSEPHDEAEVRAIQRPPQIRASRDPWLEKCLKTSYPST